MSIALSAVIVLANVAYSAHAFREWRKGARPVRGRAVPRRRPTPSAATACETARALTAC